MNAPIFNLQTSTASSIKQYFNWKSGVYNTFNLSGCSVDKINGVYEFLSDKNDQYGNLQEYYQNQSNADMYIAIYYSEWGDVNIYICEYTGDITSVNAWDHDLLVYYTGPGLFDEVWFEEPQITIDTMPTVTTVNAGTGLFSYKLGDNSWSDDAETSEHTVEGLADSSSHIFYVREKLSDATYSDIAECAFNVVFSSGSLQPKLKFSTVETDLNSVDVEFSLPSYDSKLLSGLTRDTLGVSGLFGNCGTKNGASCYRNGNYYLWYSLRFSRWLVTMQNYFDNDTNMYDYYESYLYANDQTAPDTWASGTWYVGMMGDMMLSGTPAWASGIYSVIPLGTGICRYRVDDGNYVELAPEMTVFSLPVSLGNSYSVKISERLDNNLWSPETEMAVNCHLLAAPAMTTEDGLTESDGGRNVTFKWNGTVATDVIFNGVSLQTPVFWDKSEEEPLAGYPDAAVVFIDNADTTSIGSYCALKLLPNTTYRMNVPWREGNMYDSVYYPDLSTCIAKHDYEHGWEEIATGENGGLWIYAVHDQGSWGDWKLACDPAPEEITQEDIGAFYRMTTGNFCGTAIFRYHVNSGPWSAETKAKSALQMFQLPTGSHNVYLEEKSSNGIWSETGTLAFNVINGAEAGSGDGGISVPAGKFLVMLDPASGKEYLWDGIAPADNLEPLTEGN
jgi:hypothetical protein